MNAKKTKIIFTWLCAKSYISTKSTNMSYLK